MITGAGSGIGRAAALCFAREGAAVAACDLDAGTALETVEQVRALGGRAVPVALDVRDAASVQAAVAAAADAFGRMDCALNNAGISGGRPGLDDWDEALFDEVWRVNARGVYLCMKHQVAQMLRQPGGGAIVNTASIAGLVGAGALAYAATKHAIVGISRTAGVRYAAQGVRINALCPGAVDTPMLERSVARAPEALAAIAAGHPIGRAACADEVAQAAAWLCSNRSSFVVGHPLSVDGGYVAQ